MRPEGSSTSDLLDRDESLFERSLKEFAENVSPERRADTGPWTEFVPKAFGWSNFAQRHSDLWSWAWEIEYEKPQRPFIGVWPRGGGKSASVHAMIPSLGARGVIRYVLYVSATQEQADKHVGEIANMLDNEYLDEHYPKLTQRKVNKYGQAVAWRRDRLATASGLTVDGLGLDVGARGIKFEDRRPDLIIFDDIDQEDDTVVTTDNKEDKLTRKILQTGTAKTKVLGLQNLIIPHGIFARITSGEADYLVNAEISGPEPAIEGLEYEQVSTDDGYEYKITGGTPTWDGQDVEDCEVLMNRVGPSKFKIECQHEVEVQRSGMFDHIDYRHCDQGDVPWGQLDRIVGWLDPAVTNTDKSDCQAMQFGAVGPDYEHPSDIAIYMIYSYEQQGSPRGLLQRALLKAVELGADKVGIETDQGGDTWQDTFERAWQELVEDDSVEQVDQWTPKPAYAEDKAGRGYGSKRSRGQQMLAGYERADIIHVRGTHQVLEDALNRYDPPKGRPLDLVDAGFWTWNDLSDRVNFTFT